MDSCRYDSYVRARTPNMDLLGKADRRWSYASWTSPSHYVFLMGLMPHNSPTHVFAPEVYKNEFISWNERLGISDLDFQTFLPEMSLPKLLGDLGYHCTGRVSMPVLNRFTLLSEYFDDYRLMDDHNDFSGMVDEVSFDGDRPRFYFFNLGETHYPYMLSSDELPHISGVHGVFKALGNSGASAASTDLEFFDAARLHMLQEQQIACVEYIDTVLGRLYEKAPENSFFTVTADHGELFGEDGFFGHGPIMHEKCFEVPFMEGRRP